MLAAAIIIIIIIIIILKQYYEGSEKGSRRKLVKGHELPVMRWVLELPRTAWWLANIEGWCTQKSLKE